jgi:hypothetical protein
MYTGLKRKNRQIDVVLGAFELKAFDLVSRECRQVKESRTRAWRSLSKFVSRTGDTALNEIQLDSIAVGAHTISPLA